ncbi:MAG: phosphatidylglycerophosphatase A family protein [Aeoliella sp.]
MEGVNLMADDQKLTPAVWLATGLGVGLVMPAPGTFGALWGLPIAWGYAQLPAALWWVIAVAMVLIGVPICGRAATDLGKKDPGPVVWDEFMTVPLVFLWTPLSSWWIGAMGFALHRLFDITKPWPCNRLEQLPGGWGIMLDDVAAAIYAAAVLWMLSWLWK